MKVIVCDVMPPLNIKSSDNAVLLVHEVSHMKTRPMEIAISFDFRITDLYNTSFNYVSTSTDFTFYTVVKEAPFFMATACSA